MRPWTYWCVAVLSLVSASSVSAEGGPEGTPVLQILEPAVSEGDMIQYPDSSLTVSGIAWVEGGGEIAQVTVNDEEAILTEATARDLEVVGMSEGRAVRFYLDVSLHLGQNAITVMATDVEDRTTRMTFTVELSYKPPGDVYALIIGINDYEDPTIQDLRFAENDAEAMHDLLTDPAYSFAQAENVTLIRGREATREGIRWAIDKHLIKKATRPEDMVILFYSGHGGVGLHAQKGSEYYIIPSDAKLENLFLTGIEKDQLQSFWDSILADRKVFISDACHAGGFEGMKALANYGFESALGKERILFSAARPDQVSLEIPDLKHGIFTYCLLEGFKGKADGDQDGLVSVWELADFLQREVPVWAAKVGGRQNPQIEILSAANPILSRPGGVAPVGWGGLSVEGTPRWAQVTIDGKPLEGWQAGRLKQPIGEYHLVANQLGYESEWGRVHIEKDQEVQWTFHLVPKSRWKAVGKSVVLPGWGQLYGDRKARGSLLLATQLISAGATLWSHLEYVRVEHDYEDALHRYEVASPGQRAQAYRDAEQAYDDLSDAFDQRQVLGIVAGTVWGISVLDALIAGPRQSRGPSEYEVAPTASPVGVGIVVRF